MTTLINASFVNLWKDEEIRLNIMDHIDNVALCALRLVSSECYEHTNGPLFIRTRMTFTPSAFTRASRFEALSRIGHHIEHLTFAMPHTSSTFLPPLVNPISGKELTFLYTPHTTFASVLSRPKYGGDLIGDVLTQQYPPIFHAATNVPAFIRSLRCMPNLKHLTISCPGQDPAQRYRRNAVDYAVTSLRIAIEHAPLTRLEKLTLDIHPAGLVYLRHMPGFGSTPSTGRRWKQIRKLDITMDSWDFHGPQPGLDHLKILDDYIRSFSANLEKVRFTWNGMKGPCPLMLYTDPLLKTKKTKLFAEVTSPMSPLPAPPPRPNIKFPKLRYLQVRNATVSAPQVANFVYEHRHTVREFDFENVCLAKQGTWEEALAPLNRVSGNDKWSLPQPSTPNNQRCFNDSHGRASDNDSDDFARYIAQDNEVIDTLEELRRQSLFPTETKVNTKRLKRKRRHRHKNKDALFGELPGTLFGELPPPLELPLHPANRSRIILSSQFFHHPYPPPPPPPLPQLLPSPTTPTPASRFPKLPPLQTSLSNSSQLEMFPAEFIQPFETLQPAIFDPFHIPSRTTTRSPSPPRTPPGLSSSSSTLTLTPTTCYDPETPETPTTPPHLDSPIHFHHHDGEIHNKKLKISPPPLQQGLPIPFHLPVTAPVYHVDPNMQGNQRNLHAEASRQDISDDAAKRVSVLAKARECILLRLGKEFGIGIAGRNGAEKVKEKEKEKEGFWSRFYGGGREREREIEVRRDDDGDVFDGGIGIVGRGGIREGGAEIWDDRGPTATKRVETRAAGDMNKNGGKGKTELVPLMFSRY